MSVLTRIRNRRHADPLAGEFGPDGAGPWLAEPAHDEPLITPEAREQAARIVAQAEAEQHAADLAEYDRLYSWGETMLDNRAQKARPYIPGVLGAGGRLSPAHATVEADLGACILFRDTAHDVCVRGEPHHGCGATWPRQPGTMQDRYAAIYRHRTAGLAWPDFGFAGPLRALHAEMSAIADDAEAELYGAIGVAA